MSSYPRFSLGSPVIRLNSSTRLLHIPIIASMAIENDDGTIEIQPFDFYTAVGHYLALKHFNDRNPIVLPDLPTALQGCDIQVTTEIYDSRYDLQVISNIVYTLLQREENTLQSPLAAALVGGTFSSEAKSEAILSGVYEVPLISGAATSSELENRDKYPTFARVIPTDAGNAVTVVAHFRSLGAMFFGVVYPKNEFGVNFVRDLRREADLHGMKLQSFVYDVSEKAANPDSVRAAVTDLRSTGLNYFFAIIDTGGVDEQILREASRAGIAGPGFAWFINDFYFTTLEFDSDDHEIINALNGVGALNLDPIIPPSLEEVLLKFQFDSSLQEEFISSLKNVNETTFVGFNLTQQTPVYSYWVALAYDAAMLPAYAACAIDKESFSLEELFQSLSTTSLHGSTGHIRLSNSQTRDPSSIHTSLINVVIDEATSFDGKVRFRKNKIEIMSMSNIDTQPHSQALFVFSDNTTSPPLPLPEVDINMNLISDASRISGLILCGVVMFIAIGWIMFTYFYRKSKYIRGSQPPFLYMLCIGVIVMASSIIPMSLQEPIATSVLHPSCMTQFWLLSVGFTTTFSALFCKIWRLNKVMGNSNRFRRVKVRVKDVLYPFVILLSLNILLLTIWSLVDPLVWVRVQDDSLITSGEPVGSSGSCSSSSEQTEIIFYVFFFALNFTALACANWQCYKARKINSEFCEAPNIALSTMLMTEACVMGLPVLFLVASDPSAFFLVRSILIAIVSLAVLMPIFVPKFALRNRKELTSRRNLSYVRTSRRSSMRSLSSDDDEVSLSSLGGLNSLWMLLTCRSSAHIEQLQR